MSTIKRSPYFDSIRNWTNEVGREKQAAGMGKTTHPSDKVDDGTSKPTEGARASENSKDVKKMVPADVDGSPVLGKSQDQLQPNLGPHQSATGEDPSVEDDYKDRPKDPGTSMPADASIGDKYSFDLTKADGLKKAAVALGDLANAILADITVGSQPNQTTSQAQASTKQASTSCAPSSPSAAVASAPIDGASASNTAAAVAGYELASLLGLSKDAADMNAQQTIASVINRAQVLGDRLGRLLAEEEKLAAGPEEGEEGPAQKDDGAPPEANLAEMLGGAGGPGGPGGPPPGGPGGAMPPDAGPGGPPPGPGGPGGPEGPGGPGGGMNPQALQELAMALQEMGVPLDQLAAAGQSAGGPPGLADGAAKMAAAVQKYMRSGSFRYTEAKEGTAERKTRDAMKSQLREVLGYK